MNDCNFDPIEIYIYLEGEGVDAWRPVLAKPLGNNLFQILSENENPKDEKWQFSTGETVRCCTKELSDGPAIVAIEKG
jgi:hypothetical protein